MNLYENIFIRQSIRKYLPDPLQPAQLEQIMAYSKDMKPLYPEIATNIELASTSYNRIVQRLRQTSRNTAPDCQSCRIRRKWPDIITKEQNVRLGASQPPSYWQRSIYTG